MNSASDTSQLEFLTSRANAFGEVTPAADSLHGRPQTTHYSATETIWFEVPLPQLGIVAHVYIWMRPNLDMCHAGVWCYRGHKQHPLLMEHFNYQMALPFPSVEGTRVSVPQIGLTVNVVEPLKILEVSYRPPQSDTRLEFRATAATPVAMRVNGKHFNQFMRYQGTLVLQGSTYEIDTFGIRDRSWGEPRVEDPMQNPVTTWASGIFDAGRTAFNLVGFDDPEQGAEWAGAYPITTREALLDGWYLRDGKLLKVTRMSKSTDRDASNRMSPRSIHVEFDDSAGGSHVLLGRPLASGWLSLWPNLYVWLPLMEWELDGVKGHGDAQEYSWSDYCKRYWK